PVPKSNGSGLRKEEPRGTRKRARSRRRLGGGSRPRRGRPAGEALRRIAGRGRGGRGGERIVDTGRTPKGHASRGEVGRRAPATPPPPSSPARGGPTRPVAPRSVDRRRTPRECPASAARAGTSPRPTILGPACSRP